MGFILNRILHFLYLVSGTSFIIYCLKNSVEWQVERIWGARDIWTSLWIKILELFDYNEPMLFIIGSAGSGGLVFWLYNSVFIFMDMTEKPKFLRKYKTQEGKNSPLTWAQLRKALSVILPGQLLAFPVTAMFYPIQRWRGMPYKAEDLPSVSRLLLEVAVIALVQATLFFYTHRLLHHPKVYKRVHKVHHEWTAPISIIAVYAHPIEAVISNYIPILVAPAILGSHLATSWVWVWSAIFATANDHSGYHFPFFTSSEFHDYHHLKFNQCFGVFGILDHLHGTDKQFLQSIEYKRHRMFFHLDPIRKAFPDRPNVREESEKG